MRRDAHTRVFAGMDEAGLGPLLGPLTLGWSAFRVPRGRVNLWRRLRSAVSDEPRRDRDRIVVADSKRVFTRNPRGARRLELAALSFLAQLDPFGRAPASGAELLALAPRVLRPGAAVLARHPWYALLPAHLPVHVQPQTLALRAHLLGRALERARVTLLEAGLRAVPAGALNASYRETGNKAATQWKVTSGVITHLFENWAHEGLALFVDRLGGRRHYGQLLGELFPGSSVQVRRETPTLAEYVVRRGEQRLRIAFAERGEERSFAVALASCLAKYGRELVMGAFNRYFEDLQPGLRPTAGYTSDGRRWLREARAAVKRAELERAVLVRER